MGAVFLRQVITCNKNNIDHYLDNQGTTNRKHQYTHHYELTMQHISKQRFCPAYIYILSFL